MLLNAISLTVVHNSDKIQLTERRAIVESLVMVKLVIEHSCVETTAQMQTIVLTGGLFQQQRHCFQKCVGVFQNRSRQLSHNKPKPYLN